MRGLLSYGRETQDIERVTLRIKANSSGDVYIPTAGYSTDGTQNCTYRWKVSINGGADTNYSGTGSSSGAIRVGYGLKPGTIHTVTIKPQVEDYGWCRALGYKGSSHASSLINIISDKSYKGYAWDAKCSGNYYKAYQYYGCTNLLNTDDELLPNTLELIGDYYRAYEYAGCTKLKNNAEEKILKSVKAIGDYYRAYQYQNCTSINKIGIRAINRASVGDNYRYNIFSGTSSTTDPANITIEGGICEGGSWGLADNKVKTIKVYTGLVNDYKSLLSGITSTKISNNPIWDTNEYEYLEFSIKADSNGDIKIPVAGYSTSGTQNCAYDWMVSVDGGEAEECTGTGSATAIKVGEGTAGSTHRIIISPSSISFGWGRAFGFYNSGVESLITEFVHDSYKCYATSTAGTGNYYKYRTFYGCTALTNSYEKLPTTVTSVGNYAFKECYKGCTALTSAFWEIVHKGTSIGVDYRVSEYEGCSSIHNYQGIAGYLGGTYPTNYKRNMFVGAGSNMQMYVTRLEQMYTDKLNEQDTVTESSAVTLLTVTTAATYNLSGTMRSNNSEGQCNVTISVNNTNVFSKEKYGSGTETFSTAFYCNVGDVITLGVGIYKSWLSDINLEYTNVLGLENNRISNIKIYEDDLYKYTGLSPWKSVNKAKFRFYYYDYKPLPTPDITKYTTLVGTYTMPTRPADDNYAYIIGIWAKYARGFSSVNSTTYDVMVPGTSSVLNYGGKVTGEMYRIRWWGVNDGVAIDAGSSYDVSTGYGGQDDGNVHGFYKDYNGGLSYANGYRNTNNVTYRYIEGRAEVARVNASFTDWYAVFSATRDGRYVIAENRVLYSPDKWGSATVNVGSYSGNYTNIEFSDDGFTAYCASDFGTITQYSLSAAWDLDSKSSTGKTKSVSGQFAFSKDYKYLYVFNGNLTVYQYTE